MANISLWGASYSDVPAVTLPQTGGGTVTFYENGGGASNVVTGTFKGTTTGAAMDVTLNYTGSGFPVALLIYPDGGKTSIQSINQRYIIESFYCVKNYSSITPQYSGKYQGIDTADLCFIYRNAATGSTSHSRYASYGTPMYNDQAATGSQSAVIQFRSSTKMSAFIAGTSYGFVANVDYKYWVIYSS